jgi:DNA-binding IscR family transcriptional regulator
MTDNFALEPSDPGVVPERVIDELRQFYRVAKDHTGALGDAIKAQAEKHSIAPAALRKYIAALENDSLVDAAKEAADLEKLIG